MSLIATLLHHEPVQLPTGRLRRINHMPKVQVCRNQVFINQGIQTRKRILALVKSGVHTSRGWADALGIKPPALWKQADALIQAGKLTNTKSSGVAWYELTKE